MANMTKQERADLLSLVRKRERVLKTEAEKRSAALLAEFDIQSAKIHSWDDDEVWKAAQSEAECVILEANAKIAARCRKLGIPEEFAPGMSFHWHGRGHNAVASRRTELRRAAKSKIEAMQTHAFAEIESLSLTAQTEIVANGLETDAAKIFLSQMPSMASLMPPVSVPEIQALIETRRAEGRRDLLN